MAADGTVEEALRRAALAKPFEIGHEEEPVAAVEDLRDPDRTAHCKAILVPLEGIFWRAVGGEGVLLGVELVIAVELEQCAMKTVGS